MGEPTALMNAAYEIWKNDAYGEKIKERFRGNTEKLRSEFFYLVGDCIRLSWIKSISVPLLPPPQEKK
jgi:hypothetical protein